MDMVSILNLFSTGHQLSTVLSVHVGDKSAAIDFYSKAVTELENGVSCTVNVKGQCQWQIKTDTCRLFSD